MSDVLPALRDAARVTATRLQRAAAALLLILAATVAGPATAAGERPCPDGGKAALLQGEVPRFTARLDQSPVLKIVAIGSSSTAGAGATSLANSYPSQLEADLARRFPDHEIDVINAGVNGQEVPDMVARLDQDVLSHRPDLVIWQFGANGLLRGRPLAELETGARAGIERLRRAGVEVIMMDLQHAPRIDGVAARDEVLQMMQRLGVSTGTALFHRYRMMKAWAASLGRDYADMVAPDQLHMTDMSYRCMAGALAASLAAAVGRHLAADRQGGGFAAADQRPLPRKKRISPLNASVVFSQPR